MPLEPGDLELVHERGIEPDDQAEQSALLSTLHDAIADVLMLHQRRVLVPLAFNGVPIDVLTERLSPTHGALSKLDDTRRKLRWHIDARGLSVDALLEEAH